MGSRSADQPAFILHHRPFRDTSQILDVLTLDHGRFALVARGSRSAKSRLAGILRPFQPLRLSWVMRTDMGTLTGAESAGRAMVLSGDALMAGYYVNELLLNFLHRHDSQPEVFGLYEQTIRSLAEGYDLAASLRVFEIDLLSMLGYALDFESEAGGDTPVKEDGFYEFRPGQGAARVQRETGDLVFTGRELIAIAEESFEDDQVLRAASRLLRAVISYHLDGKELKTRRVLKDLHRGRLAANRHEQQE